MPTALLRIDLVVWVFEIEMVVACVVGMHKGPRRMNMSPVVVLCGKIADAYCRLTSFGRPWMRKFEHIEQDNCRPGTG